VSNQEINKFLHHIKDKIDMLASETQNDAIFNEMVDKLINSIKSDIELTLLIVSSNELEIEQSDHHDCKEVSRDTNLTDNTYRTEKYKHVKVKSTHKYQTYMIDKELISIINIIVGDARGGKYCFVNEAIKLAIYQEFPQYAERIRVND
jgi:hypothetical protein